MITNPTPRITRARSRDKYFQPISHQKYKEDSMSVTKKTAKKRALKNPITTSPEELRRMIAEAAYYLAEQRGFEGEYDLHDWLQAEARIERIYGKVDKSS